MHISITRKEFIPVCYTQQYRRWETTTDRKSVKNWYSDLSAAYTNYQTIFDIDLSNKINSTGKKLIPTKGIVNIPTVTVDNRISLYL